MGNHITSLAFLTLIEIVSFCPVRSFGNGSTRVTSALKPLSGNALAFSNEIVGLGEGALTGTATSLGLHAMTRFKRTSALNNNINLHFIFKFPLESLDCKTAHSSKESMSIESGRELSVSYTHLRAHETPEHL